MMCLRAENADRDVRILRARRTMLKGILVKRDADGSVYVQLLDEEPVLHSLTDPKRVFTPLKDVCSFVNGNSHLRLTS